MNTPLEDAPTKGSVIRWANFYDTAVGILSLGREAELRRQTLDKTKLQAGERVLDVGCGTGTLAIEAARAAPGVEVAGLDPAAAMIERARQKARQAGVTVRFDVGVIEHVDANDDSFDVVLSSLMLHHLPPKLERCGLAEVLRVLKPDGRLLIVDFSGPGPWLHRLGSLFSRGAGHSHHSHRAGEHSDSLEHDPLATLLTDLGFVRPERTRLRPKYLFCMQAYKPA